MLRHLTNIVLNPISQALLIAVLIILFIPAGVDKYSIDQVDMSSSFDKSQIIFADLDHDGTSERIQTFYNLSGNVAIALVKGIFTLGQWNFRGVYEELSPRLMIGDFNHDKLDEIYIFTQVSDSIKLNVLQFSEDPEIILKDRFIVKLGPNLQDPDFLIHTGDVTDMNGDGKGEVVFAINAGHSRQPRNVFIYDIVRDSLLTSPFSGAFIGKIILENVDDDPFPEFLLNTYASSNYNEDPVAYSDTSSWLMALDHTLGFLFEPVEFPGPTGGCASSFIKGDKGKMKIISSVVYGSNIPDTSMLFLADLKGKILRKRIIESSSPDVFPTIGPAPSGYPDNIAFGTKMKQGFFLIDSNLVVKQISNELFERWNPLTIDIDQDHENEIILLKPDHQKHLILRNDFSHPIELDFPIQSINILCSTKLNGSHPPQLSVQGDRVWKLFDYGINPLWRFRFLIWAGIYLTLLAFIMMIRKLYSLQLKKKYETEKKISALQLSSVKAQMEPHFIMNTINTIGSSIYRKNPDEAYKLLLNFSGMVRSLLLSSDKLSRSLKEELDFVKNYLDLELSRFPEVFVFNINVDEEVDPEIYSIPKMIIQLHTENALKHGLLPKQSGGRLDISVKRIEEYLLIIITDNGIGRNLASRNMSQSTGKGMKILAQLFETYNKQNKEPLKQEIDDLYDEKNNPAGTKVRIYIPVDFNKDIF